MKLHNNEKEQVTSMMKRHRNMTAMALGVTLVLAGCAAKTYSMNPTTLTPASKGTITGETDKNANRILTLKVDYLPIITDISPELTSYIVWVRRDANEVYMNQGRMILDKDRHAELEFMVPYKQMDVLVSAESDAGALVPSTFWIMQGAVNLPN
jgi:hypothetical protein